MKDMANLMDYCELLAEEGRLAQEYLELAEKTENKKAKTDLRKLAKLSTDKMKILHAIVKDAPWNLELLDR